MNILGIGEIVIDDTSTTTDTIKQGVKIQLNGDSSKSIGGPTPAGLKLLTNLGYDATFIGTIGNDEYGKFIEEKLTSYGIKNRLIIDKKTKVNKVIVNSVLGKRTIFRGVDKNKKINKISINLIEGADAIIFDRHELNAFDFVQKHKLKSTKIIMDPSIEYSDKIKNMTKKVDYPIFPIEILDNFTGTKSEKLQKLFKQFKKTIIITEGKKGCFAYDGKTKKRIKAFDVKVVDEDGAGDVFRGGFTHGILQGWDLEKTLLFANLVAGLQCMNMGNLSAIPTKEEITKAIKKYKLDIQI